MKRGGNAENAGIRALGMNTAGWQNAAWNGVNALAENAGDAGKS